MKSEKEEKEHMTELDKQAFAAEWNLTTGYLMKDDERIKLGLEQAAEVRKRRLDKARKILETGV